MVRERIRTSSIADTIEPYGNSFSTSTTRVGNGVIVFTRSRGNNMLRPTRSIGLLSNKFLKTRSKEHIVVPMFNLIQDQGTRIFVYDIRKDENGLLELDFDRDSDDNPN